MLPCGMCAGSVVPRNLGSSAERGTAWGTQESFLLAVEPGLKLTVIDLEKSRVGCSGQDRISEDRETETLRNAGPASTIVLFV